MSIINEMRMPYTNLYGKRNVLSKAYYMIAEFIDNSIGSWQQHNMSTQLNIEINLDMVNKQVIVNDDAFGMDQEELSESMKLNKEKPGNVLSMFGVGMKNAAFFFGSGLYIYTKQGDNAGYSTSIDMRSFINDKRKLNETIKWAVSENPETRKRGTLVIVTGVYPEKEIRKTEFEKEIIPVLTRKYSRYVTNDNVNITIKLTTSTYENEKKISNDDLPAQIIPKDRVDAFIKNVNNEVKNLSRLDGMKEKVIGLAEAGLPLEFEMTVPFKNDIVLKFIFGVQPDNFGSRDDDVKTFKRRYGLTTFQKNRAINIPTINELSFGEYIRTNIKRIYGEVELGEYYKPDTNKQEFNFGTDKEEFTTFIKNEIGSDLLKLANAVFNTIGNIRKTKPGNSPTSSKKIENELKAKSDLSWTVLEQGAIAVDVKGFERTFIVNEISISDVNSEAYFLEVHPRPENRSELEITFNINHPIWKPLTNNDTINVKTVLYPLVCIMGTLMYLEDPEIKEMFQKGESDSMSQMLNAIMRYFIK